MIVFTTASSDEDLHEILALQQRNLPASLTEAHMQQQGFVTVSHQLQDLQKMNAIEPSIVAKDGDNVIAYLLAMTQASKEDIPVLIPMFKLFDEVTYLGKLVAAYNYMVVGQVCVDEAYRGKGILDNCYIAYRNNFQHTYDFAITEIASKNVRSLYAHRRIGFKEIHTYIAPDGVQWGVVIWDWRH